MKHGRRSGQRVPGNGGCGCTASSSVGSCWISGKVIYLHGSSMCHDVDTRTLRTEGGILLTATEKTVMIFRHP